LECQESGDYDKLLNRHGLLQPILVYPVSKRTCHAFNGGIQTGYVLYDKLNPVGTLKLALDKGVLVVGLNEVTLPWAMVSDAAKGSPSVDEDLPDASVSGFDIDLLRAVASKISEYYKQPLVPKFRHVASCVRNCDRESERPCPVVWA
jgi:hypothetical protein